MDLYCKCEVQDGRFIIAKQEHPGDFQNIKPACSLCEKLIKFEFKKEKDTMAVKMSEPDEVNHPVHYLSNKAKCAGCDKPIECIDVTEHMNFTLGNAVKYIWRSEHKGNRVQDLKKAIWYIQREIDKTKE